MTTNVALEPDAQSCILQGRNAAREEIYGNRHTCLTASAESELPESVVFLTLYGIVSCVSHSASGKGEILTLLLGPAMGRDSRNEEESLEDFNLSLVPSSSLNPAISSGWWRSLHNPEL